jgi:hypothetical protein
MKNIHLIPTDKPSRLYKDDNQVLTLNTHPVLKGIFTNGIGSNQHIYIISDEEIKEGDWFLSLTHDESYLEVYKYDGTTYLGEDKKIILTTDQDLINDGVQAIDDTFLEWFVNNPSCESVVVNFNYKKFRWSELNKSQCYKIIIPQEELKQETIEEAAEKFVNNTRYRNYKVLFIEGAKWQADRMYSEEEILVLLHKRDKHNMDNPNTFNGWLTPKEWFEKHKKK